MPHRSTSYRTRCLAAASLAFCVGGCSTPFEAETGESLKRSVLDSIRSEMVDTTPRPLTAEVEPIDLSDDDSDSDPDFEIVRSPSHSPFSFLA